MKPICCLLLAGWLGTEAAASSVDEWLREARVAVASLDSHRALELYLQADEARPGDVTILQQIARQYSDLVLDQGNDADRLRCAAAALEYAQKAEALDPRNAVSVLSLAIAHGKLAAYSDTRAKIRYSRLVKTEAERALALDPNYAWAHHILGRWHREVAGLGLAARGVVGIFYGGLPAASSAEAVAHLQRAVQLEPDELNHHLELGFTLMAVGRTREAREAWEHGLSLPSRGKHDAGAKREVREALAASN